MKRFVIFALASLLFLGFSGQTMARVDIQVNIPPPPSFAFPGLPELVLIPGTYVYFDPYVDINLFFYDGYWYRDYDGYWYRSVNYEGPWGYIGSPPPVLINLPPNYRIMTRGYRPIPWWEVRSHWRTWQRDRFWNRYQWNNYWQGHHVSAPPSWARRNWQARQDWRAHEGRERVGERQDWRAQQNRARLEENRNRGQQQRENLRERQDFRSQENRARIEEQRDLGQQQRDRLRERQDMRAQENKARIEENRNRMQQERERGLAPSFRGRGESGQSGQGAGAVPQRNAPPQNRDDGGRPQGGSTHQGGR